MLIRMGLPFLLVAISSIPVLAGLGDKSRAAIEIENSTKTGPVAPGAAGPKVARAQILLDRARFSPGEIDGIYGDDLGIAVKGYQDLYKLKPTGTIDAEMWRLLERDVQPILMTYTIT